MGGNQPTNRDTGRSPLTPSAREELERQGADGVSAARLAERGAPPSSGDAESVPAPGMPQADADEGFFGALGSAAGGSDDGMGIWLPILLALTVGAALAVALQRRRLNRQ